MSKPDSTSDPHATLRFAVICGGDTVESWQRECLQQLLAVDGVELAMVIVRVPVAPSPGTARRQACGLWERYDRGYASRRTESRKLVDLAPLLEGVPVRECAVIVEPDGGERFGETDVGAIAAQPLDFVLQLEGGFLQGAILGAARRGVWSFDFIQRLGGAGVPPCFWELYRGEPVMDVSLRRLSPGDEDMVLQHGILKLQPHSYVRSVEALHRATTDWPARICSMLRAGLQAQEPMPGLEEKERRPPTPSCLHVMALAGRMAWNFGATLYDFFCRDAQWNVGILDAPIQSLLQRGTLPAIRWLPEPGPMWFRADPFGIRRDARLTVLAEHFDYSTRRGHIEAIEVGADGSVSSARPVLRSSVHMAYPYLVEHEGGIYCIPDTGHQGREVRMYRALSFPDSWERLPDLIEDFAALDSTVFQHERRWWLLCTNRETGADSRLYAFYADTLMGPWTEHAANPVKVDVRSGRPAGPPFLHGGSLYRPAQDCSLTYGGAVVINRVDRLTPTAFEETTVARIHPPADSPYPNGLHTLCSVGDLTLVDGKRWRFAYQALGVKLIHILRHLRGTLPQRY